MNCVRRHLSGIKGGRLTAACHPTRVVTLLISDTPGDNPLDIASGPTLPDPTTCADALAILDRYRVEIPESVLAHLTSGQFGTLRSHEWGGWMGLVHDDGERAARNQQARGRRPYISQGRPPRLPVSKTRAKGA
ncbi:hypothetical protein ABIC30_006252 [Methylobacterium sp. 1030]